MLAKRRNARLARRYQRSRTIRSLHHRLQQRFLRRPIKAPPIQMLRIRLPPARRKTSKKNAEANPNPYSAPSYGSDVPHKAVSAGSPTTIDTGQAFSYAWKICKENLGLLLGATLVLVAVSLVSGVVTGAIQELRLAGDVETSFWLSQFVGWIFNFIGTFLGIGMTRICLGLCRRQRVGFEMLFSGIDKFLPVVGMSILYGLLVFLGLILLIIPGILISLLLWPYYYYIIDNQCPALESFTKATEVGKINMGNSFVLMIMSIGLTIIGTLAFCVGLIFVIPLIQLMFTSAYLMMKGELRQV